MTTDRGVGDRRGGARDDAADPRRVLVTGATGTVGGPLVDALREAPVRVRVAARDPAAARERFGDDLEYVDFDLERPETWGPALDGVDRLFLLFPPAVGVGPVTSFADAAARVGVDHVVYLSILGAETLPVLPHRRIERHLTRGGMAHTFLRASYFAQNLSGIHRPEIVERDEIYVPAGAGTLSFVDARDVAAVAASVLADGDDGWREGGAADRAGGDRTRDRAAAAHTNRAYDLTGPEALDFAAVAAVFTEVLERPIAYADPSRPAFARHMYARGVPASLVAFMLVEYSVVRLGIGGRTTADVARVLGRPARTVREFVADHADEFRPGRDAST